MRHGIKTAGTLTITSDQTCILYLYLLFVHFVYLKHMLRIKLIT